MNRAMRLRVAPLVLALAVAATYATALRAGFVYLDGPAIAGNPTLRHPGWRGLLLPPEQGGATVGGRPVVNVTLALNYALQGLRPAGYHLFNLMVHMAATITLWGLIRRTVEQTRPAARCGESEAFALAAALLWGVHPLNTEAVTYVVQRAESLMGLCYLFSLYAFVRSAEGPARHPRAWAAASVAAVLAGMGTKEVMASAPVMIFLFDRTFVAGTFAAAWLRRRGYYLALAACWLPLLFLFAHGGANRGGTAGFNLGLSWWGYVRTQFPAFWHYLRLVFWPHPLVFYYAPEWALPRGEVAAAALGCAALAGAGAVLIVRGRPAGWLIAAVFAILAPTSLVPGLSQTMAEHRMYLASIPVVIGIVAVLQGALIRIAPRRAPIVLAASASAVALPLGAATAVRNLDYRSELILWEDTAAKSPRNPYAWNNLGTALADAGRPGDALGPFRRALALWPRYPEAESNLGLALVNAGRAAEALAHFDRALELRPHHAETELNRGVALVHLGRLSEAEQSFQAALGDRPGDAAALGDLAAVQLRLGRVAEAGATFEAALRAAPSNAELRFDHANLLIQQSRWSEAAAEYGRALELGLVSADAHANRGAALASLGRWTDAAAEFRSALALAPEDADTHENLALALRSLGDASGAEREAGAAARLRASRALR